jgi:dolichyl-phosphate beta-glucosyltransferase
VPVPAFFTGAGALRIPAGSTVLVLPEARPGSSLAMTWQAAAGLRWRMPGGYFVGPGPDGRPMFGARTTAMARTLRAIDRGGRFRSLPGRERRLLVADLLRWRVGTVVVGPGPRAEAQAELVTSLLGRPGEQVGGVTVWYGVEPGTLVPQPAVPVVGRGRR